MQTQHLLLIDGDDLLRQTLAEQLAGQGYRVSHCQGGDPVQLMQEHQPDIILVETSQENGAAFCQELRAQGYAGAILALGGTRITGATATLAKPFRLSALTQQLQLLRREAPPSVRLADHVLYPTTRLICDPDGRSIRLTEKEVAILCHLHKAGNRIVGKEELLGEVWGYAGGATTHTVETHIYRLRRKLGDAGLLVTDTGGYRLSVKTSC